MSKADDYSFLYRVSLQDAKKGRHLTALQIAVPTSITADLAETGLIAVLGGVGLMYFPEPLVAPYVADGRLRLVLPDWASKGDGFHIYYSSRRQVPTGCVF